jgi:hypothetical protein
MKLVFIYSTPFPEVELCINQFRIHQNAVAKGASPKPKLRKIPTLKALMVSAYQKARKSQQQSGSHVQTNCPSDDSFASQHDQSPLSNHSPKDLTSQTLLSQVPSHNLHGAPNDQDHPNTTRTSLVNSKELLLARLADSKSIRASSVTRTVHDAPPISLGGDDRRQSPSKDGTASKAQIDSLDLSATPIAEQPLGQGLLNSNADEPRGSNSTANSPCADIREDLNDSKEDYAGHTEQSPSKAADNGAIHKIEKGDSAQPSKKRHRDSTGAPAPSQTPHTDNLQSGGPQNTNTITPSKKRQRTDAGEAKSTDPSQNGRSPNERLSSLADVQRVDTKLVSAPVINHWEGIKTIPASEIEIPKDQEKLLSELKWIPQETGESAPLCHVPPHLLSKWNKIAQRRQRLAETPEQIHDRSPTPTPQETNPSIDGSRSSSEEPYEWEPSEPPCSPRKALPPDSSPIREEADHEAPAMTGTQDRASQLKETNDGDTANEIHVVSQTQAVRPNFVCSKDVSNARLETLSRSLSKGSVELPVSGFSVHAAGGNPSEKLDCSRSVDMQHDNQPSSLFQEVRHDQSHSENESHYEQSGYENDDSDDGEMETSVPFALGQSVPLSSLPEQETTSSGPPLPRLTGADVQVVETPVLNITRPRCEKQIEKQARSEIPSLQESLSQDVRTSFSSRVLNTYPSRDSQRQSDLSQDAPNSPLPDLEIDPLRVDMLRTQTQTSSIVPSQATLQSSSDVVLDSSRPIQRQRGSSIFHLEPWDDPSSYPYASPHLPTISCLNEPSQDSTPDRFNLDGASRIPDSPSIAPRTLLGDSSAVQKSSHGPDVDLVARRQGFIGKGNRPAEAQTIYEKFRNAYSPYSGDFFHFIEMCFRLHTIRKKGLLQRSFLWDDFIILSLEEYPHHFEQHATQDSKTLDYEEFFCSNFSRPRYKKRSLTAHEIDVAASMASPEGPLGLSRKVSDGEQIQNEPMQNEGANPSFTASLVDKFSDLRARSLDYTNVGHTPSPLFVPLAAQSSNFCPVVSGSNATSIKQEEEDSPIESIGSQMHVMSNIDQSPVVADLDTEMVGTTQSDANGTRPTSHENDVDMAEDDEADTTYHETASIELGDDVDDRHVSAPPALDLTAASADNSDTVPPRQRRTWFRSLKNIFPTGPVWSDDLNTPFKRWARQDQNLLQEINRRGGTKVLLDEKGVIRRPTYNRETNGTR